MLGEKGGVFRPHSGTARAEKDVKYSNTGDQDALGFNRVVKFEL